MASKTLRLQAAFLICLLVGDEALRISEHVSFNAFHSVAPNSGSGAQVWKKENSKCSWSTRALKCQDSGCAFRPLILDRSMSSSCRLSLNHMLGNSSSIEKYVGLQANLLAEKSVLFRKAVASTSWLKKAKWQCLRSGGYMLQASEFLAAVKEKVAKGELSIDIINRIGPTVAGAIKSLVDSLGKDGDLVLEFQQKLAHRRVDVAKNPERTAKMMVDTIWKLFSKSESEREVARASIKNMPTGSQAEPSEEERVDIKHIEDQVKQKVQLEELDGLSRIEEALTERAMNIGNDDNMESSLLQNGLATRRGQVGKGKGKGKRKGLGVKGSTEIQHEKVPADATENIIVMVVVLFFLGPPIAGLLIVLCSLILVFLIGSFAAIFGGAATTAAGGGAAIVGTFPLPGSGTVFALSAAR